MTSQVTYDNLPQAVMSLHEKLDAIGGKIENLSRKQQLLASENDPPIGVEEAAKLLMISKAGIYAKVSRNAIPYYKTGGKLYFSRAELIENIHAARHPAKEQQENEELSGLLPQLFIDRSSPEAPQ